MPNSRMVATVPLFCTQPADGEITSTIILSRVLLPAPLRPINPTASPGRIAKLTSLSTHWAVDALIGSPIQWANWCQADR